MRKKKDHLTSRFTLINKQLIRFIFLLPICLSVPLEAAAQTLAAISGPTHGKPGDRLTFVVEARDSDGNPESGASLLFGRSPSDGTSGLGTYAATTGAGGRAQTTLILESDAGGSYRITAWRADDAHVAASFSVTVDAVPQPTSTDTTTTEPLPEPTTLVSISGDDQEGPAGTVLAAPFVVEVHDENGEPLEGATVTFVALRGGGAMSVAASKTDVDGRVASVLTLGTLPGTNKVQVKAEGISQLLVFSAEATNIPSEPMPGEEDPPSMPEPTTSLTFNLSLPSGISLIHIPLEVTSVDGVMTTIKSVADLYDALGGANTVNHFTTYAPDTQVWHSYRGPASSGTIADKPLTDAVGIVADMKTAVSIQLRGEPLGLDGVSAILLHKGVNLVGLPLRDRRIDRVSDLFEIDGMGEAIVVIIVWDNGVFKTVSRAGGDGNIPVTGGQAFLLTVRKAAIARLSGEGWDNTTSK